MKLIRFKSASIQLDLYDSCNLTEVNFSGEIAQPFTASQFVTLCIALQFNDYYYMGTKNV